MGERLLAVIVATIAVLLVLSLVFMAMVIVLRAGHARARRRAEGQDARWRDRLLAVIAGAGAWTIQEQVRAGEELAFLAFLLRFSRQLRGEEARILALVGAPFVPAALREMGSRSPERRAQATQAVAMFGMPTHADVVLAALDDPSPYVAVTAAQALAMRPQSGYATQVVRRVQRFGNWSAEYLSAMIARIGPDAAEPARRLLADVSQPAHARAVAASVLTRLNDPAAADTACDVLGMLGANPWSSSSVQAACLRLLAQVGGGRPAHLAAARRFLASTHPVVRGEAVRALVSLGGAAELGAIAEALGDDSRWVAQEAARGLLRLGQVETLRVAAEGAVPNALVLRQVLAGAGAPT